MIFPSRRFRLLVAGLVGVVLVVVPGCQTLRQVANLRNVDFQIDDVEGASLAGVDLSDFRSTGDVRAGDLAQLTRALADGEMPLRFTLVLGAENPSDNEVDARLVKMDWTLLLEDRETVSGTFDRSVVLPPGEPRSIPVEMRLDLLDFFDRSARDLLELALAVSGTGGAPKEVKLRARPTIETPIGPIRYPRPITIVSREVGES